MKLDCERYDEAGKLRWVGASSQQRIQRSSAEITFGFALFLLLSSHSAQANPEQPVVTHGNASFTTSGSKFTIQTSANAFINWKTFNIAAGETTVFAQPSSTSVVWNHINDANPSQILGQLDANGYVILQNSAGFAIGGQAVINAAGLIMTTTPIPQLDTFSGGMWNFTAPPPSASIINYGQINVAAGGSIFLIARDIDNKGSLIAPGGHIGLYAGKNVLVSERPDGLGLTAQVNLPEGSVDNGGKLIADGGTIALHAQIVNQGGLIQANSVREHNGVIELVASDAVNLSATSDIEAKGDSSGISGGGSVLVKADNSFTDQTHSTINVSGGRAGGNGGDVEISAAQISAIQSTFNGQANAGFTGGNLLIDPQFITLASTGSTATGSVQENDSPSGTLTLNVSTVSALLKTMASLTLAASDTITVSTLWNIPDDAINSTLNLQAGNNITINTAAGIMAGQNVSLNLNAGTDLPPATVVSTKGNITLNGTAFLQTMNGSITLNAQNGITVGSGAVRTFGGGSITATAKNGSVNTGSNVQGYTFKDPNTGQPFTTSPGYAVSTGLGGISTGAGGDVTISAGVDVISLSATAQNSSKVPLTINDAGSGAFGPGEGVVTITAGRDVDGNFVAANSSRNGQVVASTITAGRNVGTAVVTSSGIAISAPVALSVVKGGWKVNAPNGSIYLQEVRNPNGALNSVGNFKNVFDYDAGSFVNLAAENAVYLTGANLPRNTGDFVPIIYPPQLTITVGQLGEMPGDPQSDPKSIFVGDSKLGYGLTLYPSKLGELNLTTYGGGSLQPMTAGTTMNLVMSDSGATQWTANGDPFNFSQHASSPIELDNPDPAIININGNINNLNLYMPKAATVTVGGNLDNSSYNGQNLISKLNPNNHTTTITVDGRIFSRNQATFDQLDNPLPDDEAANFANPNFASTLLDANGNPIFAGVPTPNIVYVPGSTTTPSVLELVKAMNPTTYQALVNTDQNGNPLSLKPLYVQLIVDGQPQFKIDPITGTMTTIPLPDLTHPVNYLDLASLTYLFQASQDVPATQSLGYFLGGPGQFNITAGTMDLGSSPGINSQGPVGNFALANLGSGADITITVTQPDYTQTIQGKTTAVSALTMYSSTISTFLGGNISIDAQQGSINVGSQDNLGGNGAAPGIYTIGPGDVSVSAQGNIEVAGSRIATFNGGDIFVKSRMGEVNAGNGEQSDINLTVYQIDPVSQRVDQLPQQFGGSGILAYTLPPSLDGNDSLTHLPVTIHESPTDLPGNITVTTPHGGIIANEGGIVQEPLNGNESPGPAVTLTAGYDPDPITHALGPVVSIQDIDVTGSGVIGGRVTLNASGNIKGLVIGRQETTVSAVQSFNGTVLSGGAANVSVQSGGTISGLIIGVGGINVSGGASVDATLLSQNVSIGGAKSDLSLSTTASATSVSQSAAQEADSSAKDKTVSNGDDSDDEKKKKGRPGPLIARSVGRVTVILPTK